MLSYQQIRLRVLEFCYTSEVTVWAKGINFRASQSHADMYASIDLILDKLQKQITKYKKRNKR